MSENPSTYSPPTSSRAGRRFGGLFWKFILILTPVFLVLAVPGISLLIDYQLRQSQEALSARIGNQAARVADALARHQGLRDARLAQDLIAPLASDRAFLCAEVRAGANGELLVAQPQNVGCQGSLDGYALTLPVGGDDTELLVRFTDIEIKNAERLQSTVSISVVGLAFILAVIASMVGFRLIINRPLNLLISTIRKSAETGVKSKIDFQTQDELGTVISAYNDMLFREAEREKALLRSNKLLEESEALRQSEERYRRLVDVSPDGVIVHTDARIVFANTSIAKILGAPSPEKLISMSMDSLIPSSGLAHVRDRRKNMAKGADVNREERQLLRLDGSEFSVELAVARIHWESKPSNLLVIRDISERKRTEEALRESEERFRAIFDNSPAAIMLKNLEGRIQLVNKRHLEWFGGTTISKIGKTAKDLLPRKDADQIAAQEIRVIAEDITLETEHELKLTDGLTYKMVATKFPVYDGDNNAIGVGTIQTDVTEMRRIEDQLRQSQKMEAVGQLTGGIAHEFNNMLMAIVGNLDLLIESSENELTQKLLNSAMHNAMRGGELTRQLLAFSRKQNLNVERVKLDGLMLGMRDMLQRTLGETIQIVTETGNNIWPVLADAGQIEGALLNLALNASDAMPQGGPITFSTSNQKLDARYLANYPELNPGEYVKQEVMDTGCGMSREILSQVFDPFFTTKDVGEGTGLGLSMVHGFVEQSGGFVEIDSEIGRGTRVSIYLPRTEDEAEQTITSKDDTPLKTTTGATILVVEDDPNVRELVVRQLSQLGYNTVEAIDGVSALAAFDERSEIDVLFTDVILPGGMSGPDIAQKAQHRHPSLKTVFTSGYPDMELPDLVPGMKPSGFLRKPYRQAELAETFAAIITG